MCIQRRWEIYSIPARRKGRRWRPIWSSLTKLRTGGRSRTLQQCVPANVILYTIIYRCPLLLCKWPDYETASVDVYVCPCPYITIICIVSGYLWCIVFCCGRNINKKINWRRSPRGFLRELYTSSRPFALGAPSTRGRQRMAHRNLGPIVYSGVYTLNVLMVTSPQCKRLIYERENINVDEVSICHTETTYYM